MIKQVRQDDPLRAPVTIRVISHAGMFMAPHIHERVRWASIEAQRRFARAQHRDVGDAAQVQHDPCVVAAEHACVKRRDKGRALTAGGDIPCAEIRNDSNIGEFDEQRRGIKLNRVSKRWLVANCLAMGADRRNVARGEACRPEQPVDHVGVYSRQRIRCKRRAGQLVIARAVQCEQLEAQRFGERIARATGKRGLAG